MLPERRHRDDGVPKSSGNGNEIGAINILLGVEHDRSEDDNGHRQREDQKAQLTGAALQRVAQNSQSLRVARKFEYAEHAKHAQCHECT